jgi:hypothetical protein
MKSYEFLSEGLSDIAIELEDYKKMSPAEFQNAYGLSKQRWYQKYQGVTGKIDQHHTHKAHSYVFHIPGEDPQLNQNITRHFDSEQEAQKFYNQLRRKHYGVTMNRIN